jgi:hypothetical protein
MAWKRFHFESNQFFDGIETPNEWILLRDAYPKLSDDELLAAKEATYRGTRTTEERLKRPNFGFRIEHDGEKTLRDFFVENGMLELIPKDRDSVDAARYRWLRAQHWSESKVAVVTNPKESVKLGRDCPAEKRLDRIIDDAMSADEATESNIG